MLISSAPNGWANVIAAAHIVVIPLHDNRPAGDLVVVVHVELDSADEKLVLVVVGLLYVRRGQERSACCIRIEFPLRP